MQIKAPNIKKINFRRDACNPIVYLCKTVIPNANKEFETKKINNLRGLLRKKQRGKGLGQSIQENWDPT